MWTKEAEGKYPCSPRLREASLHLAPPRNATHVLPEVDDEDGLLRGVRRGGLLHMYMAQGGREKPSRVWRIGTLYPPQFTRLVGRRHDLERASVRRVNDEPHPARAEARERLHAGRKGDRAGHTSCHYNAYLGTKHPLKRIKRAKRAVDRGSECTGGLSTRLGSKRLEKD